MFRCSIRDLLWLTALVALGVGWWLDHRRQDTASGNAAFENRQLQWRNDRNEWIKRLMEGDGWQVDFDSNPPKIIRRSDQRIPGLPINRNAYHTELNY